MSQERRRNISPRERSRSGKSRLREVDSAQSSRDMDSVGSDDSITALQNFRALGERERRETTATILGRSDGRSSFVGRRGDRRPLSRLAEAPHSNVFPSELRGSRVFERHRNFVRSMCPMRFIIVAMGCAGTAIMYGLRINLDVFVIVYINHTAMPEEEVGLYCSRTHGERMDGPFPWDATTQRVLVASYNLGFIASHIPGAFMAMKSSAKWLLFVAVIAALVVAGVFPVIAYRTDWGLLSFFLLLEGLCGGIIIPGITTIMANWAPPSERGLFGGFVFGGLALGQGATWGVLSIASWQGWKNSHQYLLLTSLPWLILWPLWVNSSPISSIFITQSERSHILVSQKGARSYGALYFPFGEIRTSVPFWVLTCAHFGAKCMYYMLFFELPHYFYQVLHVNYEQLTLWFLPSIALFVVSVVSGCLMDLMVARKKYDRTLTRKVGAAIGILVPSVCLFALCFTSCDITVTLTIFIVSAASMGTLCGSIGVNHMDLSPNFAGALMGITGTIAGLPTLVVPTFMGSLTLSEGSVDVETKWAAAFVTVSLVNILCCIAYVIWSTAETQPWNAGRQDNSTEVVPNIENVPA